MCSQEAGTSIGPERHQQHPATAVRCDTYAVQIISELFSSVPFEFIITRVADPDPHGSALFLEAGSRSALEWKAGTAEH